MKLNLLFMVLSPKEESAFEKKKNRLERRKKKHANEYPSQSCAIGVELDLQTIGILNHENEGKQF